MARRPPPEICPECGTEVPRQALCCPECGSDEDTGWSAKAEADRLGIVDPDDFDYEAFVQEEFGGEAPEKVKPRGIAWGWWAVAVGLLILFGWWVAMR